MAKFASLIAGVALIAIAGPLGIGFTIGAFTVTTSMLIATGLSLAVAGAISLFRPRPSFDNHTAEIGARMLAAVSPSAARWIIFGRDTVGAVITYKNSVGANNIWLHVVYTIAGHRCDAIEAIYFGADLLAVDGSNNFTSNYNGHPLTGLGYIETHLGDPADTTQPFPRLAADTDVAASAKPWGSSHLQRGCCKVHIAFMSSAVAFAGALPNVTFKVKGYRALDRRTATTAWTLNSAVLLDGFLQDKYLGWNAQASEITDAIVQAAANLCDENVALHGGGNRKRYTASGTTDTSHSRQEIASALLGTMGAGAALPYVNGQYQILGSAWRAPTVTLTSADIREGQQVSGDFRVRRSDLCNGVRGTFKSPSAPGTGTQNQVDDYPAYWQSPERGFASDAYFIEDGNERLWKQVDYSLVQDGATCQTLAKIELERVRRQKSYRLPCKLSAWQLVPGDVFYFTFGPLGANAATLEVTEMNFVVEKDANGIDTLGIDVLCRAVDANIYAWTSAEELALGSATTAAW